MMRGCAGMIRIWFGLCNRLAGKFLLFGGSYLDGGDGGGRLFCRDVPASLGMLTGLFEVLWSEQGRWGNDAKGAERRRSEGGATEEGGMQGGVWVRGKQPPGVSVLIDSKYIHVAIFFIF